MLASVRPAFVIGAALIAAPLAAQPNAPVAALARSAGGGSSGRTRGKDDPITEDEIAQAVWEHAPAVIEARRQMVDSEAFAEQTRLLPNPGLSGTWATIPVGPRNPPTLSFWDVPSYSVGVSELVELGKRGPRRRVADATVTGDRYRLQVAYLESFFAAMESVADQAAAVARAALLSQLAEGSAQSLALQRIRAEKGDAAGLDVDRIEVDHLRLLSKIAEANIDREAARRACAIAVGRPCPNIDSLDAALAFLERGVPDLPTPPTDAHIDERPDVRALTADRTAATEAKVLASRLRIPDPTLGVSYTHDQFTVAGNQANSLTLSLSLPMPIFDYGQAAERRADRQGRLLDAAIADRRVAARAVLGAGWQQLELVRSRTRQLQAEALPRAVSVVQRMEIAARRGGAAWPDVLLARRALEELQLERVEAALEGQKLLLSLRHAAGLVPVPNSNRGSPE